MKPFIKIKLREFLSYGELKNVENNLDDLFADVNVDINFSDHFIDRVNDPRNGKEIEPQELENLFVKSHDKHKDYIKNIPLGGERVVKDVQSNINIPIVATDKTKKTKVITAKTIMRKPNFLSSTQFLKVWKILFVSTTREINGVIYEGNLNKNKKLLDN